MQVQQGVVKYKDRSDIVCTYGITDDGKQYYFIEDRPLTNGNLIVTSSLVEAIDPLVRASHVGVIDASGKVIIPLENKTVKSINNNLLLVEKAMPTTESVLEAIKLKNDPLAAAKLVTTPATIKDRISSKMSAEGRFVFNDQFSEATIFDLKGNNLINNEYYSFIGVSSDKIYFSKNTVDSPIVEFSLFPTEVANNEINKEDAIAIEKVAENSQAIEKAINEEISSKEQDMNNEKSTEVTIPEKEEKIDFNFATENVSPEIKNAAEDISLEIKDDVENVSSEIKNADEDISSVKNDVENIASISDVVEKDEEKALEDIDFTNFDKKLVTEDVSEKAEDSVNLDIKNDINEDIKDDNSDATDTIEKADESTDSLKNEKENDNDDDTMFTINFDVDDEKDELDDKKIFGDSLLSDDKIVDINALDLKSEIAKDDIIDDVTRSIASLIDLNRKQHDKIIEYEKLLSQQDGMDDLNSKIKNYETIVHKLEERNQELNDKVNNQARIIETQEKELNMLRPQAEGREELLKLLADAHNLLVQDDQDDNNEVIRRRRAA